MTIPAVITFSDLSNPVQPPYLHQKRCQKGAEKKRLNRSCISLNRNQSSMKCWFQKSRTFSFFFKKKKYDRLGDWRRLYFVQVGKRDGIICRFVEG